ncbi:FMN reductase [Kaistia dalseonensis]|uniref:FMN reductase n=1 Tax=Kaistia dalseonensis TaxID=410840 RepID=A0ABU0H770_9HYPH|nr:FMN reductase [Kaistia dalseonensis]MCX5495562.1 FMN reductase [Kaistia dalseonensis]MDQ0438154.1 FMN reductase [Kaistia dalseonensis]
MVVPSAGRIVGISGNITRPSKTRALVETIAAAIGERHELAPHVFDLVDFGPSLGAATSLAGLDAHGQAIVAEILSADLLVVASPIFKGSYSGLFKHLFDLLDPASLAGKTVVLAATGGSDRHTLALDHQLRPLLGFFMTHTIPTGIFATAADFIDGKPASAGFRARLDLALADVDRLLTPPIPSTLQRQTRKTA